MPVSDTIQFERPVTKVQRVLDYIRSHPEGVKPYELHRDLGYAWGNIGSSLLLLMERGAVRYTGPRYERTYYPVEV